MSPATTALAPSPPSPHSQTSDADADSDEESVSIDLVKVAQPGADGLVSKPEGEVGRLKRGYPLQAVLGWDPKHYKQLKAKVNAHVADYLNYAASSSNQPAGQVEALTKLILAGYPKIASRYRDGWPISNLIHLRLKYTSGRIANRHQVPQSPDYPKPLKYDLAEIEAWVRSYEVGSSTQT